MSISDNNGTQYLPIPCEVPSDDDLNIVSNTGSRYMRKEPNEYILWGQSYFYEGLTDNNFPFPYYYRCGRVSDSGLDIYANNGTRFLHSSAFNCVAFCDNITPLTFTLDFTNGEFPTSFGGQPITFARASGRTRWNSTPLLELLGNNVPALDHDPVTGARLGYLAESQKVNLHNNSDSQTIWVKVGSGNFEATDEPFLDGSTNKTTLLTIGGSSDFVQSNQTNITSSTSTQYTFSFFVKPSSGSVIALELDDNSLGGARYRVTANLASHTAVASGSGSSRIAQVGCIECKNGWSRVFITFTTSTTSGNIVIMFRYEAGQFFVGGRQFETGGLSSYVPTTTATATRQADTLTIPTAGWFNPLEGTFILEVSSYPGTVTTAKRIGIELSDVGNDRFALRLASSAAGNRPLVIIGDGVTNTDIPSGTTPLGANERLALSYSTDRGSLFSRNGVVATSTRNYSGFAHPTLKVGPGDAHIKSLVYIPKFLATP